VNEITLNGTVLHLTDDKARQFQPSSKACYDLCISTLDSTTSYSLALDTADYFNRKKMVQENAKLSRETLLRLRMYVILTDPIHSAFTICG
jgi:hypothetical protein